MLLRVLTILYDKRRKKGKKWRIQGRSKKYIVNHTLSSYAIIAVVLNILASWAKWMVWAQSTGQISHRIGAQGWAMSLCHLILAPACPDWLGPPYLALSCFGLAWPCATQASYANLACRAILSSLLGSLWVCKFGSSGVAINAATLSPPPNFWIQGEPSRSDDMPP